MIYPYFDFFTVCLLLNVDTQNIIICFERSEKFQHFYNDFDEKKGHSPDMKGLKVMPC